MTGIVRRSVEVLDGYVPGEQLGQPGLIKLNTNENPYPPSPEITEAIQGMDLAELRRYPDPLSVRLREKIASIHSCGVDNVFVGNGSDEVLALCTRAFVENDAAVGFFEPSYSLYPVLAAIRDVASKPVQLGEDFDWPAGSLSEMVEGCSLFFLTNPNAPTGVLYDKSKVRTFCEEFPGVVVIDEAYVDFARYDCVDLAMELENVVIARTLSKGYSLAGIRMGYSLGSPALTQALAKIKDSYNTDAICQRIAHAALSDIGHMRGNAEKIKATRQRLTALLEARGFSVLPSDTNFLWVRPHAMGAKDLFLRLREKQILIRYFQGMRTGDYLRVTVGTDAEVDMLVAAVDEIGDSK